jgi:hypothetical protein
MSKELSRQQQITELKHWIATLKDSYKTQLKKDVEPLELSPGVRQTVKRLFSVRWNFIVLPKRILARWLPAGEAEAGSAGVQPTEE